MRALVDGARNGVVLEDVGLTAAAGLGLAVPRYEVVPGSALVGPVPDLGWLEGWAGERVVVKVLSPAIPHRAAAGGLRIIPRDPGALEGLLLEWKASFREAEPDFMVQELVAGRPGDPEVLLGFRTTAEFGPVVAVAPGGSGAETLTEALRPGVAPLFFPSDPGPHRDTVREILSSAPFLPGESWAELLTEAVLQLAERALPWAGQGLAELEFNPVRLVGEGPGAQLMALDALGRMGEAWAPAGRDPRPVALDRLLRPETLAVAGVSSRGMNPGRVILRNTLAAGFPAEAIQVVKPAAREVDGVRCVEGVESLEPPVDLLVVGLPAPEVPGLISRAVEAGAARSFIVISGGLEEGREPGDPDLAGAMRDALALGRRGGADQDAAAPPAPLPLVGSNCLGIRSAPGRYDTLFIPAWKLGFPDTAPAPVALLSQSGAFAIARASGLAGVNPRYVVTLGTQLDVTVGEMLEHLLEDPELRTAACYVEGFRPGDGRRFMAAARAWREAGRRVLLYRAGRSPAGRDAAASHTAALAGDYPVTRGLCTQVGVQVLDTVEDFQDQLLLAALLGARTRTGRGRVEPRNEAGHGPRPGRPPRVALLSNAGFECVSMADHATGLEVAGLSPESVAGLDALLRELGLREIVAPRNPLDLTPIAGDAGYARAAALLLDDPGVDCAVVSCVPLTPALQTLPVGHGHPEDLTRDDGLGPALIRLWEATEKPWVVAVDAGPAYEPFRRSLADSGIPVFSTADRAVRALASWAAAGG